MEGSEQWLYQRVLAPEHGTIPNKHTYILSLSLLSLPLFPPSTPRSYREQESEIEALKASQRDLQARNESVLNRNRELQEQLAKRTEEAEAIGHGNSTSSLLSSSQPSITRITATLDLDLSQLASGSSSTAGHASAIASVPLQFNSQYCSTMEQGL